MRVCILKYTGKGCKDKQQIEKKNQQWLFLGLRKELWAYPIIFTWAKCLYITSSLKINLGKRGQGILRWEIHTDTIFYFQVQSFFFFLQPLELVYVTKILNFHRKKHKDMIKSKVSKKVILNIRRLLVFSVLMLNY